VTKSIHRSVSESTYSSNGATNERHAFEPPSSQENDTQSKRWMVRAASSGIARKRTKVVANAARSEMTVMMPGSLPLMRSAAHRPQRSADTAGKSRIRPAHENSGAGTAAGICEGSATPSRAGKPEEIMVLASSVMSITR